MLNKIEFLCVVIILSFGLIAIASAKILYETDFNKGTNDWDLMPGGGTIELGRDDSVPRHGPNVLIMDDTLAVAETPTIAYIKDLMFTDGFIQILWKDGRLPEDTDGPISARAQDETFPLSYDIELDTDTGLHIEGGDSPNNQAIIDATMQPTLMSTGEWTWIKARFEGNHIQVKSWVATKSEPANWQIDWVDTFSTYMEGNVGLRAWSGQLICAYYLVTDLGGYSVDGQGKLSTTWGELKSSE